MQKIILASNNQGKIKEFNAMLKGIYQIVSMAQMNVTEVPETGVSFVENALIKAKNAAQQSGLPALADDSGIVVDSLSGAPGIYSARYAGDHGDDEANVEKLLKNMQNHTNRKAHFWCAIAFISHADDPTPIIIQKSWTGEILHEKSGNNGFGYDPIFYLPTHGCSAAQLPTNIKNQHSHRAKALRSLLQALSL